MLLSLKKRGKRRRGERRRLWERMKWDKPGWPDVSPQVTVKKHTKKMFLLFTCCFVWYTISVLCVVTAILSANVSVHLFLCEQPFGLLLVYLEKKSCAIHVWEMCVHTSDWIQMDIFKSSWSNATTLINPSYVLMCFSQYLAVWIMHKRNGCSCVSATYCQVCKAMSKFYL